MSTGKTGPDKTGPDKQDPNTPGTLRVGRWMARAGLCSRRQAEDWIGAGRVSVDGTLLTHPACRVDDPRRIEVDGNPLPPLDPVRLWVFHKPRGVIVTRHDPQGRRTLFDILPPAQQHLITVGRLDYASEGLILLTNDGGLARHVSHPKTGWTRRYRVRARGRADPEALANLARGLTIDHVRYGPIQARLDSQTRQNCWLSMALTEGKNREIRRVLAHLGLDVNRLIRLAYGPFQLGSLPLGTLRGVPGKVLREQVGSRLTSGVCS